MIAYKIFQSKLENISCTYKRVCSTFAIQTDKQTDDKFVTNLLTITLGYPT